MRYVVRCEYHHGLHWLHVLCQKPVVVEIWRVS